MGRVECFGASVLRCFGASVWLGWGHDAGVVDEDVEDGPAPDEIDAVEQLGGGGVPCERGGDGHCWFRGSGAGCGSGQIWSVPLTRNGFTYVTGPCGRWNNTAGHRPAETFSVALADVRGLRIRLAAHLHTG
ncbi:hypothetical protein AB0383_27020 [Amycolatopsis sp. NPDC051373]|uniref:hypothetical protein n=1 Tax=Amycolatopsis sp. NPDC051373 TaxID=3155801 RepID=UPI00344D7785